MTETRKARTVAVLGTGIMGAAMAARLAERGFAVRVWNRTSAKALPLADEGCAVAASARDAISGAQVVITMLSGADAVLDAVRASLDRWDADTVWLQTSTVGVEGCARLAEVAGEHGIAFVDAPVLGTRQPARDGKLRVLASGPDEAIASCSDVIDALGQRLPGVGGVGAGSRLKLAVNAWVLTLTDATAQSLALARGLGLDPALFLTAIESTPTDSPYAHLKGPLMLAGDYPAAFATSGARKDAGLIRDAGVAAGVPVELIDVVASHLDAAIAAGHGDDDMASVVSSYGTGS